jgi:hypothetical protein
MRTVSRSTPGAALEPSRGRLSSTRTEPGDRHLEGSPSVAASYQTVVGAGHGLRREPLVRQEPVVVSGAAYTTIQTVKNLIPIALNASWGKD